MIWTSVINTQYTCPGIQIFKQDVIVVFFQVNRWRVPQFVPGIHWEHVIYAPEDMGAIIIAAGQGESTLNLASRNDGGAT